MTKEFIGRLILILAFYGALMVANIGDSKHFKKKRYDK